MQAVTKGVTLVKYARKKDVCYISVKYWYGRGGLKSCRLYSDILIRFPAKIQQFPHLPPTLNSILHPNYSFPPWPYPPSMTLSSLLDFILSSGPFPPSLAQSSPHDPILTPRCWPASSLCSPVLQSMAWCCTSPAGTMWFIGSTQIELLLLKSLDLITTAQILIFNYYYTSPYIELLYLLPELPQIWSVSFHIPNL